MSSQPCGPMAALLTTSERETCCCCFSTLIFSNLVNYMLFVKLITCKYLYKLSTSYKQQPEKCSACTQNSLPEQEEAWAKRTWLLALKQEGCDHETTGQEGWLGQNYYFVSDLANRHASLWSRRSAPSTLGSPSHEKFEYLTCTLRFSLWGVCTKVARWEGLSLYNMHDIELFVINLSFDVAARKYH